MQEVKDQLLSRHGVSVPVNLEDLVYDEKTNPSPGGPRLSDDWNISDNSQLFAKRFYAGTAPTPMTTETLIQ